MRRTGSEEIGSSKAFGRGNHFWRTEGFAFSDFFGEAPERRPWITEHDDAGRSLPGFIFAFVFYWLELPTDCALQPIFLRYCWALGSTCWTPCANVFPTVSTTRASAPTT